MPSSESYLYRTVAFHKGMGATLNVVLPPDLVMPDVTIFLECDEPERLARLSRRIKPVTYWDVVAERCIDKILDEYAKFPMERIDTSRMTCQDVVLYLLEEVVQ